MTLHHLDDGSVFPKVDGKAANFLNEEDDLVALKMPTESDLLSRYLRTLWLPLKVGEPLPSTLFYLQTIADGHDGNRSGDFEAAQLK